MQGMVPLSGFGGVPYSAVRKAAPRNILDNSDFTNLVAQAGIGGNHGTIAYAADRWILDSGTVSYEAGVGLTLNGTIRQKLERIPAAAYPYIGMASGEASISYDNGTVSITSSGGVIKWAALYTGEYSRATMPEYQPKGYSAELTACRRYYRLYNFPQWSVSGCYVSNLNTLVLTIDYGTMRVTPSVSMTGSFACATIGGDINFNDCEFSGNAVNLRQSGSYSNAAGMMYASTEVSITLSADL